MRSQGINKLKGKKHINIKPCTTASTLSLVSFSMSLSRSLASRSSFSPVRSTSMARTGRCPWPINSKVRVDCGSMSATLFLGTRRIPVVSFLIFNFEAHVTVSGGPSNSNRIDHISEAKYRYVSFLHRSWARYVPLFDSITCTLTGVLTCDFMGAARLVSTLLFGVSGDVSIAGDGGGGGGSGSGSGNSDGCGCGGSGGGGGGDHLRDGSLKRDGIS